MFGKSAVQRSRGLFGKEAEAATTVLQGRLVPKKSLQLAVGPFYDRFSLSGPKWAKVESEANNAAVESPRGIYQARVDEKGRLKLPVDMQQLLNASGEQKVFITSLDEVTARIYPIAVWRKNEMILAEATEDPETAEDIAFLANDLGADSEVDGQGRVLLPTELRRLLHLEGEQVWLECYQGGINIYNKDVYEARKARARENRAAKLSAFRKLGLR